MQHLAWLHWYMAGFLALMGVWNVSRRSCFSSIHAYCRVDDADEDASERRLAAAYGRRANRERDVGRSPGLALGGLAFALAALAATTSVSVAALYAAYVVGQAIAVSIATGLVKRSHRRVASLAVRASGEAVPRVVVGLVGSAALAPLVWLRSVPGPALVVTVSGLVIVALGSRVAWGPAELEGDDVEVEAFVDRRVRAARAAGLFAVAPAPAFVFASFSGASETSARVIAVALAFAACAIAGWRMRGAIRKPSVVQLEAWLHAAS